MVRRLRPGGAPALMLAILFRGVAALAQAPACRADLQLEPARPYVGQELIWRLQILRPAGVVTSLDPQPSFPDFRAEWIPSQAREDPLTGMRIEEKRRALFPGVAGQLQLPAAALRCGAADDAARIPVPARLLEVRPAPRGGRPADWRGLVGPVDLSVLVTPRNVVVGQSVRVSVEVQGAANVWDVAPPLVRTAGDTDAEIFPHPPELARDTGERLVLRRYFTYDVVPRRAGRLEIPELRVPWLDPQSGRYQAARRGPFAIRVLAAPAATAQGREQRVEPGLAAPPAARRPPGPGWIALGAAALVLLAAAGICFVGLRRRGGARSVRLAARSRLPRAVDRARALESQGDSSAAAAALALGIREVLTRGHPEAAALSAEELLAASRDPRERDLAQLLAAAERLRFSVDSGAGELRGLLRRVEAQVAPDGRGASR